MNYISNLEDRWGIFGVGGGNGWEHGDAPFHCHIFHDRELSRGCCRGDLLLDALIDFRTEFLVAKRIGLKKKAVRVRVR